MIKTLSSTDKRIRKAISEIHDGFRTEEEVITELVQEVRNQALGWMYAEACTLHNNGMDIRGEEVPNLLARAQRCLE